MTTYDEGRPRLSLIKGEVERDDAPAAPAKGGDLVRLRPQWEQAIERFTAGEPEERVAPWLKDGAQCKAMAGGVARFTWHRVSYHAVRAPLYGAQFTAWAPRGAYRGARWVKRYVLDDEAADRAREVPLGDASYERLIGLRDRHIVPRLYWVGFLAFVTLALAVAAWVKLPRPVTDSAAVGAVVAAGWAGAPRGKRRIKPAVVKGEGPPITPGVIVAALAKLGISEINAAVKENADSAIRWVGAGISRDHIGKGTLVQCELPPGALATDVLEKRPKLASALTRALGCVWVTVDANRNPAYLEIWISDENLNRAKQPMWPYLKDSAKADYFEPFQIGTDQMSRPVLACMDESGSILAGQSGFGKTSASAVLVLYTAQDPTVEHWIVDLAGKGDWTDAQLFAARYVAGQDDEHLAAALDVLRAVREEVRKRAAILESLDPAVRGPKVKVTRATANSIKGLHPLHVIIDECQELFAAENKALAKEARKLAIDSSKLGRALGLHMQFSTQQPTQDSFPVALRNNLRLRGCFRVMADGTSKIILGDDAAAAGVTATLFTVQDFGLSQTVGPASHDAQPTITKWHLLDGPDRLLLAQRGRRIREDRGMLRGLAAGIEPEAAPDLPAWDFLADAATVAYGRKNLWSSNLLELLAATWPNRYEGWTPEQLAASFRPYGVSVGPVHDAPLNGTGNATTRRGYVCESIRRALLDRDTEEVGE